MKPNLGYDIGNNKWFLGQVPPGPKNQHLEGTSWSDAHGDRVKVRIPGMHPMSSNDDLCELPNSELPWAIVAKPTTSGNRNKQSTGIWGGEWVIGFFLDSDCQIPIITQVLGNNEHGEIRESDECGTLGKRVKPNNAGNPAINTQIKGPPVTKQKFESESMPEKSDALPPQEQSEEQPVGFSESEGVTQPPQEEDDFFEGTAEPLDPSEDAFGSTVEQTPAEAAAQRERRRQNQTVERAIGKMNTGDIAVQPGGVVVNRTPTPDELQQFESKGYRYVPGSDGGGKIVKNVGQNYG